jgi:hypothetical protein
MKTDTIATFTETIKMQGERYTISGKHDWDSNSIHIHQVKIHDLKDGVDDTQDVTLLFMGKMNEYPALKKEVDSLLLKNLNHD